MGDAAHGRCDALAGRLHRLAGGLARDPDPDALPGHRLDVAKAVEAHPQAKKLLADKATSPGLRRTMVMTAIIMGFPVEG